LGSLLIFLLVQNNRASQMKFIADRKVPKFRALAIRKIKIGKVRDGERPNWGLAQLMRPAKAAAAVPLANLPLCQRPNACASNHRGFLARW
jgi:hypothetical protein